MTNQLSILDKLNAVVQYINNAGGSVIFHQLNELMISTIDPSTSIKTLSIQQATITERQEPFFIQWEHIDNIYDEMIECIMEKELNIKLAY